MVLSLILVPLTPKHGTLAGQVSPGPLAGPHEALEGTTRCTNCHGGGRTALPARCLACHKDIDWLASRGRGLHGGRDVKGLSCASCHPEHAGRDFNLIQWPDGTRDRFDHRRSGWPLQQSHASIACDKCHTPAYRRSPAARLTARNAGGRWTGLEPGCTNCHEDVHRGALTQGCTVCHDAGRWTVTPGFSHDTTGFALTDKHKTVACAGCHLNARLTPARGPGGLVPVYKPVPHDRCTSCHQDPHRGQFGTDCDKCHSTAGWRRIDREAFDHDRTRYPLRGRHAAVSCRSCHRDFATPESRKPGFQTCTACHTDVHNGTATLGGQVVGCERCHTVGGFSPASYTVDQHRNTRYPLEGEHRTVSCTGCHRRDNAPTAVARWGSARVVLRPAYGGCTECHSDEHGGQLAGRADRGECSACHQVAGWKPSSFDRAAHGRLRVALDGRHGEVSCRACHGPERVGMAPFPAKPLGGAKFLFRVAEVQCADCHADPHRGRFAAGGPRAKDRGCLACHNTVAFRPSTAGIAEHAGFGYPLEGAHRAAACAGCHVEIRASTAKRTALAFATADTECAACHRSPHGRQFDTRKDKGKCDACHGADAFRPATRFDHDRDTSFPIRGAHERVACAQCHPADPAGPDARARLWRPVQGKCESCHARGAK